MWKTPRHTKRWFLAGQRPVEGDLSITDLKIILREVVRVSTPLREMLTNMGNFDIMEVAAPGDASTAIGAISLPERLDILLDAVLTVVMYRAALRHPATYNVLGDIINDDLNGWAQELSERVTDLIRMYPGGPPTRADAFPDIVVPSWSALKSYVDGGGLRTTQHLLGRQVSGDGNGGGRGREKTANGYWGYCHAWATPAGCHRSQSDCRFEHAHDPEKGGGRAGGGGGSRGRRANTHARAGGGDGGDGSGGGSSASRD